jgi:hypothetical protein
MDTLEHWDGMRQPALRLACTAAGIPWRVRNDDMRTALVAHYVATFYAPLGDTDTPDFVTNLATGKVGSFLITPNNGIGNNYMLTFLFLAALLAVGKLDINCQSLYPVIIAVFVFVHFCRHVSMPAGNWHNYFGGISHREGVGHTTHTNVTSLLVTFQGVVAFLSIFMVFFYGINPEICVLPTCVAYMCLHMLGLFTKVTSLQGALDVSNLASFGVETDTWLPIMVIRFTPVHDDLCPSWKKDITKEVVQAIVMLDFLASVTYFGTFGYPFGVLQVVTGLLAGLIWTRKVSVPTTGYGIKYESHRLPNAMPGCRW